ncbi:glycosyltransferase [Pedobacter hiemivivus]|uniref:Glycosyltransferase n=1 Tax=Pedobacter hiemivivus TaxID=2530454 RepID=A0A4U1GDE6_9SPHI|nr:glycosyltransferase [Pedobacter hiemivivus]TKC60959.1 glycosyltransferase [Pedobacter hiemivivus]
MAIKPLNIFYKEPDPDRWFKYDRYLRSVIRYLIRGKQRPGGVMLIALSLMKGLDKLGIPYRFNDFAHIRKHPDEIACIIGKPHLLFERSWINPVIFGAGVFAHPIDHPDLFSKYPNVKRFLVPGDWMKKMCEPYYGDKVLAWPAGIDTDHWSPSWNADKEFDFLIYDKRGKTDLPAQKFMHTILSEFAKKQLKHQLINYGDYSPAELKTKLANSKAVLFLSRHETQGQAYQQVLSTNTPILAWDKGGYWQDPAYFPYKVKYEPVSAVPYWDERCGLKFSEIEEFPLKLTQFLKNMPEYKPRQYILEQLTLEKSAQMYCNIVEQVRKECQQSPIPLSV